MCFMKLKFYLRFSILLVLGLGLVSWGGTGHRMISLRASLSFNQEMEQFQQWADYLSSHASDPDYRKGDDPTEGPKHYIDIDNYPEFEETGIIPMEYNEVAANYGEQFVIEQGTLPWATLTTMDSLTNCFERKNWDKAAYFAADLGHYVADGHMPLHITRNYNGQYSGNTGIHSRYESGMINTYQHSILYTGKPAEYIEDPTQAVFDYIYHSYVFVDSILIADTETQQATSSSSSSTYTEALWTKTAKFTTQLFSDASHAFACLIYTAWINAGSPQMNPTGATTTSDNSDDILQVHYTTVERSLIIKYHVPTDTAVTISVLDSMGRYVETLINSSNNPNAQNLNWKPKKTSKAVYFVVLQTENLYRVRKVLL